MTMTMPCTQVENSRPGWECWEHPCRHGSLGGSNLFSGLTSALKPSRGRTCMGPERAWLEKNLWERFWTYDFNLTCFPDAFPASSNCTTVISSGLQNSSSWRMNSNYTWTTCSKVGSSAWNSKKERQEGMSATNMSSKSPFGSASHFANIGSWKAGSPISNPLLLKAQSRQAFVGLQQSRSTTESTITVLWQILETTTPWPNPLLLCMRQVFFWSCNEGMGMMQAQCRIGGVYCPCQGPQASGSEWTLRFHRRHEQEWTTETNMSNHVEQVSFRQCITFREHRQLKGWQPAS